MHRKRVVTDTPYACAIGVEHTFNIKYIDINLSIYHYIDKKVNILLVGNNDLTIR